MSVRISIALVLLVFVLTGCGSMRSSPDTPMSAGGLTPTAEDKEAGLVGIAPDFDLKAYRVIGVSLFGRRQAGGRGRPTLRRHDGGLLQHRTGAPPARERSVPTRRQSRRDPIQ